MPPPLVGACHCAAVAAAAAADSDPGDDGLDAAAAFCGSVAAWGVMLRGKWMDRQRKGWGPNNI